MNASNIHEYVTEQESAYENDEMRIGDNWNWNMRQHIQLIFHLKNGMFFTGENNWLRAFKNIMEPVLNLSYWSEDIELKDIVFYIEEEYGHILSFLVKKYHDEVFVRKYNIDEMLDEITESDIDYGGVLVQKSDSPKPETLELNTVAFCDQTNILGGPIGVKHNFSPDKLREMSSYGWGDEKNGANISLEELITLAEPTKNQLGSAGTDSKTSGKNIQVYIVRGNLPEHYLKDNDNMDDWYNQLQIVAFYYGKHEKREGVVLYRKKEEEGNLKFFTSKKVYGRGLGRGVGESLLHPQIWTNFLTIHKTALLEAASKVPLYTDDAAFTQKNKIQEMENLEITTIEDGKRIFQMPTAAPVNVALFDKTINEWHDQAQYVASAFDPMMGKEAVSGTTFRGQNQIVQQGKGIHDRRRGQRAKFIEEIYRDWIIPEIKKEILKGPQFLATLSLKETQWVTDALVTCQMNDMLKEKVLNGELITQQEADQYKQMALASYKKQGNKFLFKILKDEFQDIEIKMGISIANKQKDLVNIVDKLMGLFDKIASNPMLIKSEPLMELFNEAVEYAGFKPIDLTNFNMPFMPTRRMTETIDYKDLALPPNDAQKQMLTLAGIEQPPAPAQPTYAGQ